MCVCAAWLLIECYKHGSDVHVLTHAILLCISSADTCVGNVDRSIFKYFNSALLCPPLRCVHRLQNDRLLVFMRCKIYYECCMKHRHKALYTAGILSRRRNRMNYTLWQRTPCSITPAAHHPLSVCVWSRAFVYVKWRKSFDTKPTHTHTEGHTLSTTLFHNHKSNISFLLTPEQQAHLRNRICLFYTHTDTMKKGIGRLELSFSNPDWNN